MANRTRPVPILFYVSPEEYNHIQKKMAQYDCSNLSAYLRKMAVDGYVINLSIPEIQELSSLLRRAGNNINQIAKRANETRHVYDTDLQEIMSNQRQLLDGMSKILKVLTKLE